VRFRRLARASGGATSAVCFHRVGGLHGFEYAPT
jgi:hypothetical protein